MKALSMAALGLLLVIIIVVSALGAYKEHFQNPTQGGCACDNYNNGENAPGSPTYQCYAEYGSDGSIVPTCNQTAEGKLPNEQDCKTGCRRKYCKWGDADGIAVCMNQDGPPGPGPVGPTSNCIYAQPPEMPTCAPGCELTDSSNNRIKCYATSSDTGGMNLCGCLVQGIDPATDQQACSACPSCQYCVSTSQCMSKTDYNNGKCPDNPNPLPGICSNIQGKNKCNNNPNCQFCRSTQSCMSNQDYDEFCPRGPPIPPPIPPPNPSPSPSPSPSICSPTNVHTKPKNQFGGNCNTSCYLPSVTRGGIDKCYSSTVAGQLVNTCGCRVSGLDPEVDRKTCESCPTCTYCQTTRTCMSNEDHASKCDDSNPSGSPSGPSSGSSGPSDPSSGSSGPSSGSSGPSSGSSGPSDPSSGPSASTASSKQKKSNLLRDIRDIVHNELMLERGMTSANAQPLFQTVSQGSTLGQEDVSPALYQGQEMGQRPKWCPKNMDDYIRKDSIPCYGCNLGY